MRLYRMAPRESFPHFIEGGAVEDALQFAEQVF